MTKICDWDKMYQYLGIVQKVYERPSCPFAKVIPTWLNHFGKRTDWTLINFLIYAYLNILAQSQILVISLKFLSILVFFVFFQKWKY